MGRVGDWIEAAWGSAPVHFTVARGLSDGVAKQPEQFVRGECYVEIYLESCRLERGQKLGTRFHGVVYCFVRAAREGEGVVELAAVTKPDKLADLDPNNLHRVITVSKKLIGPTPWRGGALGLELGLCSVKQSNLMSGVLTLVGKIAESAGIGFVAAAKPFLPLIQEGMDLIAGQINDTAIEVALDTDLPLQTADIIAIIAKPKDQIDKTVLSIDPQSRELLENGQPVSASYCVLSIRPVQEKADFGAIPDLKAAYEEICRQIVAGEQLQAENAVHKFIRIALVSPDLITADRQRLADRVNGLHKSAFGLGPQPVAKGDRTTVPLSLSDIGLYEQR